MPQEFASGLWRSQDMVKVDIIMQRDATHDVIHAIGMTGMVQFVDCNENVTAFQKQFSSDIRRCDDLDRRLRWIKDQMNQSEIDLDEMEDFQTRTGNHHYPHNNNNNLLTPGSAAADLNPIESALEEAERELKQLNSNLDSMGLEKNRCRECFEVLSRNLQKDGVEGQVPNSPTPSAGADRSEEGEGGAYGNFSGYHAGGRINGLLYVAGVVNDKDKNIVANSVYRVTRGQSILQFNTVDEPFIDLMGNSVQKSVFVVYVSAERAASKLQKLLPSLGATLYQFTADNQSTAAKLKAQLSQFDSTMDQSRHRKNQILYKLAQDFNQWVGAVKVEKAIYATLNKLNFKGSVANGQCWIATADLPILQQAVDDGSIKFGSEAKPIINTAAEQRHPPTKFSTNKMTAVFQGIVDSYGVARYKEVNPGVLTIVTFPWLFGIMYGDIGHGVLITAFAAYMILREKAFESGGKQNEIFLMIFGGRYLILFMGLFAIYIGLLYNDFFGVSLSLFSSAYIWPEVGLAGDQQGVLQPLLPDGRPNVKPEYTYAFGIDVAWTGTDNKLEFYNSVKMKCAVIVGIVQMTAGLICSLMNHIYHKEWKHVVFGFVPEMIFLMCTFGYMALLIIAKWCIHWDGRTNDAPSLLEVMTNFFLAPGDVKKPMYAGQAGFQVFLLLVAWSQVPILLLGVPFWTKRQRRLRRERQHRQRGGGGGGGISYRSEVSSGIQNTTSSSGTSSSTTTVYHRAEDGEEGERATSGLSGGYQEQASRNYSAGARSSQQTTTTMSGNTGIFAGVGTLAAAPTSQVYDSNNTNNGDFSDYAQQDEDACDEDEQPFSEIMIHYIIHTIEFVLGCVSNTASYLRLWALSLAHAQLSEVFLDFGLVGAMSADHGSGIVVMLGVAAWLGATVLVLCLMESLSAFLHALRLHWVEFQNKFYKGDGTPFLPLDLMEVSKGENGHDE